MDACHQIDDAVDEFLAGNFIMAGNDFLDLYEAVQNAQLEALSIFTEEEPELKISSLRRWERYIIQDAALCFYLADNIAVEREKATLSEWPKTSSSMSYKGLGYKQGVGIGAILKDCITPLDVALSGCTSNQELAKRLSMLCHFLTDDKAKYLPVTESIMALGLAPTNPQQAKSWLKDALELAQDSEDTSASNWIKDCISKIQNINSDLTPVPFPTGKTESLKKRALEDKAEGSTEISKKRKKEKC